METYFKELNIPSNVTHVKIDVGLGLNNVQSQNWLRNEKDLFVFMFDPNMDSIISSINNMKMIEQETNRNNNFYKIMPIALSNVSEETIMDFYSMVRDGGTSSLYKPTNIQRLGPIKNVSAVPVYSLKHFFDLFPWDRFNYIDYIKIDAQGADLDIIKSAGDYLIERVVFITAEPECEDYDNCYHNTSENMEQYLITQNFIKIKHPNTDDPTFINKKFIDLYKDIYIFQK